MLVFFYLKNLMKRESKINIKSCSIYNAGRLNERFFIGQIITNCWYRILLEFRILLVYFPTIQFELKPIPKNIRKVWTLKKNFLEGWEIFPHALWAQCLGEMFDNSVCESGAIKFLAKSGSTCYNHEYLAPSEAKWALRECFLYRNSKVNLLDAYR